MPNLLRPKEFPQNPLRIAAGSPLAIQGVFLEILRSRFKDKSGLSWVWREDWTTTDILIESAFNVNIETRNQTPAIYVHRLSTVPSKQVLGDRASVSLPDHRESHKALNTVAMMLECVSNDEAESAILADLIQFTVLATRDVIIREFGFYDLSHPSLGQTTPYQQDQTKWTTPVEFMAQFWIQWEQVPIAPLLQQISQRITQSGSGADDYFIETTINSMRRGEVQEEPLKIPDQLSGAFRREISSVQPKPVVEPIPSAVQPPEEVYVIDQPVLGVFDGINKTFQTTLPFVRNSQKREAVFVNGLRMVPGADNDYVVSKSHPSVVGYDIIALMYAPRADDIITVDLYVTLSGAAP